VPNVRDIISKNELKAIEQRKQEILQAKIARGEISLPNVQAATKSPEQFYADDFAKRLKKRMEKSSAKQKHQ